MDFGEVLRYFSVNIQGNSKIGYYMNEVNLLETE